MQPDHQPTVEHVFHTYERVEDLTCEQGTCQRPADWICTGCWIATCNACAKKEKAQHAA